MQIGYFDGKILTMQHTKTRCKQSAGTTSLHSKRSCTFLAKGKPRIGEQTNFDCAKNGESAKNEARGRGGEERRKRLHPTIVNLKFSVRQPTEPLIGSKLDR